jgi:hypothetical protein
MLFLSAFKELCEFTDDDYDCDLERICNKLAVTY